MKLKYLGVIVFRVVLMIVMMGAVSVSFAAQVVDRIIAIVNDDIISLMELNELFYPYEVKIKSFGYSPDKEREMLAKVREDILNKLIDQKLTDQQIKERNIQVGESEIDAAIERIKETSYFTDEELKSELAKQGILYEDYRKRIREQIQRTKLLNLEIKSKIVITREEIKAYYEAHPEIFEGEKKYHLRNIVMKIPPLANESEKAVIRKKMDSVAKKLSTGESFEKLAELYSESPLASDGGDLGTFKLDDLSDQMKEVIKNLNPGQFSPILETEQGLQLIYVDDILDQPRKTLDEASSEIEEKLYLDIIEQKYRAWVDELRQRSYIKISR